MSKLVYGAGVYAKGEFKRTVVVGSNRVNTREYELWRGMLRRCYNVEHQQKNPTYIGCGVSDNFKYFQHFAKWCQSQIGFGLEGFQLDKDILVRGNKMYSEGTCVFVPQSINKLLNKSYAVRGGLPIGVCWHKAAQMYYAQCSVGTGKQKYLGLFSTPEDAFDTYKPYKESLIKRLAGEYQSVMDSRVYEALMSYQVLITD